MKLAPAAPGWEFVLVGPEAKDWHLERPAESASGLSLIVRSLSGVWHRLRASANQLKAAPDVVVAHNSGIGTMFLSIAEPWLATMADVLALDVPLLLTCFHAGESSGEQQRW